MIGNPPSEANVEGDMPLASQFGYLFSQSNHRTIAHEVGHGAFNLEHPFSRGGRDSFAEGALTDNLMDYTQGTNFAKLQWDQTRIPGLVIGLLQGDKDGMLSIQKDEYVGFSPNGYVLTKTEDVKTLLITDDNRFVSGVKTASATYLWNEEAKQYLNGKEALELWDAEQTITGRVAVWINQEECYKLYRYVAVNTYKPTQFSSLQDSINSNAGTWIADYNVENPTPECQQKATSAIANLSNTCSPAFVDKLSYLIEQSSNLEHTDLRNTLDLATTCSLEKLPLPARKRLYEFLFKRYTVAHPGNQSTSDYHYISNKFEGVNDYLIMTLLQSASAEEQAWFYQFLYNTNDANRTNLNKLVTGVNDLECITRVLNKTIEFINTNSQISKPEEKTFEVALAGKKQTMSLGENPIMLYYENWLQSQNTFKANDEIDVTCDETTIEQGSDNLLHIKQSGQIHINGEHLAYNDDYQLSPWQPVRMYVGKDMADAIPSLTLGASIRVPAITAYVYYELGQKRKRDQNLQIGVTAVAGLFAMPVAGSVGMVGAMSELVVLASTVNIAVLASEDTQQLSLEERGRISQWKTFYNYLLIADAGVNLWSSYRAAGAMSDDVAKLMDEGGVKGIRTIENYTPTSGTKLIASPNKTTTILGRWRDDMAKIKSYMKDVDFNVGTEFGKVSENKGGFNFLNIPDDLANTSTDFFNQYNKPWLDAAISRGDDIILATKPIDITKFITKEGELLGMYAEELKYLANYKVVGYKPINLTQKEWEEIVKWFKK
jgi:hypothetical protein